MQKWRNCLNVSLSRFGNVDIRPMRNRERNKKRRMEDDEDNSDVLVVAEKKEQKKKKTVKGSR